MSLLNLPSSECSLLRNYYWYDLHLFKVFLLFEIMFYYDINMSWICICIFKELVYERIFSVHKPLVYKPTINNRKIICFCKIFVIINHEYLYFSPSLIKRKFNTKCMLGIYYYFKAFNLFIFLFSYSLCIDPEIPFQNIYHVVHK